MRSAVCLQTCSEPQQNNSTYSKTNFMMENFKLACAGTAAVVTAVAAGRWMLKYYQNQKQSEPDVYEQWLNTMKDLPIT